MDHHAQSSDDLSDHDAIPQVLDTRCLVSLKYELFAHGISTPPQAGTSLFDGTS
jgi:hypothetical protein